MNRILVVNPYGLGDVLFTSPLISALRRNRQTNYLAVLVGSRTQRILEGNPNVDEIFVFDKDLYRSLPKIKSWKYLTSLLIQLRRRQFTHLFDLSLTREYAFYAKSFLRCPNRIGFNYKNRGIFLNYKLDLPEGYADHRVWEYYNLLLQFIPGQHQIPSHYQFFVQPEDHAAAQKFMVKCGIQHETNIPLIIMAPGGGKSWGDKSHWKQWPEEHFVELIQELAKQKIPIVMIGDKFDEPLLFRIKEKVTTWSQNRNISLNLHIAIDYPLGHVAAILTHASIFICNDGGLLHLAASLDVPTLSFFGPVNPQVYGPPESPLHKVLTYNLPCHPCYKNFRFPPCPFNKACLHEITPQLAFKSVVHHPE